MDRDLELIRMQETVDVSDEEIAAKAKMSSKTVQRAKKKQVSAESREAIVEAIEALRVEKNSILSKPLRPRRQNRAV
jgi:DNA-binding LacI/PurR family transcriptional regulator